MIILAALMVASLWGHGSAATALLSGATLALLFGNPFLHHSQIWASRLLTWAIVGLGAGMNLATVGQVGLQGLGSTFVGLSACLTAGWLLGKLLRVERTVTSLVTVGTAICGGSAIAAVGPVLGASAREMSLALSTVFLLNAVALLVFPYLGHALHLSGPQFGLWCGLAIHDTSSVVGAAMGYGSAEALPVATTVKLARALWIVPLTLLVGQAEKRRTNAARAGLNAPVKRPWFILGFLLTAACFTWFPALAALGHWINLASKRLFVVALLLIGVGMDRQALRGVGLRPLLLGATLWVCSGFGALLGIEMGWIKVPTTLP